MKRSIMMGLCLGVITHAYMGIGVLGPASAYDTVAVKDGAVVRGMVTFQGTAPEPEEFDLRRYSDRVFCGALSDSEGHRFLKEVNVGQGSDLKDVVVVVEGVQSGKPLTFANAQVEANVCQFLPFVTVVSNKRQLTVTNRDPVSHDIQGYTYDQAGVDIVFHRSSLTATGTTDIVHLVKGRKVFTMQCGMHPYMQNWGYAIDNPYYVVTDQDGSFSIGDLPPGAYRVKAWHPILGAQERELTAKPNDTVTLDVQFDANVHHCGEVAKHAETILKSLPPTDEHGKEAVPHLQEAIKQCKRVDEMGDKVDPGASLNPAAKARAAAREAMKHLNALRDSGA